MSDEVHDDDEDDDEGGPAITCEMCGKEEEEPGEADTNWISIGAGNANSVYVDICPECAESDQKLKAALDVFIVEYRERKKGQAPEEVP